MSSGEKKIYICKAYLQQCLMMKNLMFCFLSLHLSNPAQDVELLATIVSKYC